MATLNSLSSSPSRQVSGWLTISRAASLLGVSDQTVRNLCAEGSLDHFTTSGGHRRISAKSVRLYCGYDDDTEENGGGDGLAVYCRVSSEKQNARGSLDRQISRLVLEVTTREGVNRDGVKVYKEVCSSYSNRPVLNALISDIISGGIRKLYCECEDRLSRISSTTSLIYHLCKQFGVQVVCLDREEENEDELEAGMKELLAHAGIITARIHAKKSTLVTRKEVSGECIAKMIELRQQGHTLRSIANEIEKQGFKTSHGDSVSYAKVRQLIDANGSETLLTKVVCGEGDRLEESCRTFIESRIRKTEGEALTMGDIYPRYVSYCQANGKVPQPRNILGRHLIKTLGRHNKKVAGARYWVGYSVG